MCRLQISLYGCEGGHIQNRMIVWCSVFEAKGTCENNNQALAGNTRVGGMFLMEIMSPDPCPSCGVYNPHYT